MHHWLVQAYKTAKDAETMVLMYMQIPIIINPNKLMDQDTMKDISATSPIAMELKG